MAYGEESEKVKCSCVAYTVQRMPLECGIWWQKWLWLSKTSQN